MIRSFRHKGLQRYFESWALHPLKGALKGHWAITVRGNWRIVFTFEGSDAILVDYLDYH